MHTCRDSHKYFGFGPVWFWNYKSVILFIHYGSFVLSSKGSLNFREVSLINLTMRVSDKVNCSTLHSFFHNAIIHRFSLFTVITVNTCTFHELSVFSISFSFNVRWWNKKEHNFVFSVCSMEAPDMQQQMPFLRETGGSLYSKGHNVSMVTEQLLVVTAVPIACLH